MRGLNPAIPQKADGMRTDPPVSVPRASGTIPAATATALPLLEPPAIRARSCGLRTGPLADTSPVAPNANSCVPVFPTITAPAFRSIVTHTASSSATCPSKCADPIPVGRLRRR